MTVRGLILVLLLPLVAEAQQQYYGTRLSSIAISGSESQADLQTLPLQVGDILSADNLRAAIQALYDTRHYSSIEADAERAPDGTTSLTFRVRPVFFFSTFRIEPDNLLDRPLSSYFRLPFGEKFTTTAGERGARDTTELLVSEGYFKASVVPVYESDEQNHLMVVTLKITPGAKARIGKVRIQGGEQTFSEEELADEFGLKTGDIFSSAKLDKGVSNIRAKFAELRFLNTRVDASRIFEPATNTVDLNVMIQPGQFALVQTRGFDISAKKVKELV